MMADKPSTDRPKCPECGSNRRVLPTFYGPVHTPRNPAGVHVGGDLLFEGDTLFKFWCEQCDIGIEPFFTVPAPKKPPEKSGSTTTNNPFEGGTKKHE